MSFLSENLFGRKPKTKIKPTSTLTPEQSASLKELLRSLSGGGTQATPFEGQLSAGISPFERSSLTALEERSKALALPGAGANFDTAGGTLRELMDFEGQTASIDDYFTKNVQNPLVEDFGEEILPAISRDFGGADFFSTERQAAEGGAREDLLESLAGGRSALALEAFESSRNRALQAAGQVPGLEQAQNERTQSLIDILSASGLDRQIEQEGLDRTYSDFIRQIGERDQNMARLLQAIFGPAVENIVENIPGTKGTINIGTEAFAQSYGSTSGQMLGSMQFMSDRSVKKDLKQIGEMENGIPVYSFKYLWDDTDRFGVIADEVEKIVPDAVVKRGGFSYVDYSKLGV